MLRWFLLVVSICLFALGLLTVFKSPAWSSWKLALLAGEFGHWLALAAIASGLVAWWVRGNAIVLPPITLVLCATSAVFLLKPVFQAWRMAPDVAQRLSTQFVVHTMTRRPFSFAALAFGRNPEPVPVQTFTLEHDLPLDFYRAAVGGNSVPCVVVVHGGGWDSGDRLQLPGFNHWLARSGYAVAAISYRLAPGARWPAQRDDVGAAIRFLKTHAREFGIDPTRLVLLGRSAGGQIALSTAYTAGDPAIRGVIALYAPSDLVFGYVNTTEDDMLKSPSLMRQYLGGTPETARANYESASPLFHVTPQTLPTLLIHGEIDALVWYRHSVRLDARLEEQHVPHVFVNLPWATHAIEYNLQGPGGQLTTYAVEAFLSAVTKADR